MDSQASIPLTFKFTERARRWTQSNPLVQSSLYIFCWLSVWLLAYIVEYVNHASVWFPAAGMTFAGLLVVGARLVPALVICAVVSTIWAGYLYQLDISIVNLFISGCIFALTHIAPYYLATTILKWLAKHHVNQLPTLMLSFLIIAVISSLVTAFAVIHGLVYSGLMGPEDIAMAWLPFWVGDMAGVIAVGPLFVGIIAKLYTRSQFKIGGLQGIAEKNNSQQFTFKLVMSGCLLGIIMVLNFIYPSQESNLSIFIMILPLMWISYTESPIRTAISVALFSLSVAFLVNVFGLISFVITYQFAICIIAASAFFYLTVPSLLADNQVLRQKIMTDHLTGVASRDYLLKQAEIEIAKSVTQDKPLSLIMLDVDNFKKINDTLGHAGGDRALIEISRVTALSLRKSDILSRFGGDEFVILLPNTSINGVNEIAKRILNQVRALDIFPNRKITCSLGVTQLQPGEGFRQLFERADRALYSSKNGGRDQVQVDEVNDAKSEHHQG